jgi:bacterioferritin (cytochrome b1)
MSELRQILEQIVLNPNLHARFLNTLSYMENVGARKISKFESRPSTNLMILKHAAEEHRHAYFLKKQIFKLVDTGFETYEDAYLMCPKSSANYLDLLDLRVCKLLKKELGLQGSALKWLAYLFVTYAIEVRADEIYPKYQEVLTEFDQKVHVKSIIIEEEGHLEEMIQQLSNYSDNWREMGAKVCDIETQLFNEWVAAMALELPELVS